MSGAIGTLSIDIEARLARLEQGLDQAARINARAAREVESSWSAAGASLKAALAPLAAALSVGAIVTFVRNTVDAVDALNDVADVTGATIENISALQEVAMRTGTAIETVEGALLKFNQVLSSAKPDSEADRALRAIGLSAQELREQDPAEALRVTAEALAGFADDGDKARLVQELFGKSVKEIGPYLKDLAAAGKLNATVTAEQAAEAEKLNKLIAELQTNMSNWSRGIQLEVLPVVNTFIRDMRESGSVIDALAKKMGVDGLANKLTQLGKAYELLTIGVQRANLLEALGNDPGNSALQKELAALEARGKGVASAFTEARNAWLGLNSQAGAGRGFINPPLVSPEAPKIGPIPDAKKDLKEAARSFEDYASTIKQSLANMVDSTEFVRRQQLIDQLKALDDLAAAGLDPQIVREVRTSLQGPVGPDIPADILKQRQADATSLKSLLDSTPSAKVEELTKLQAQLSEAYLTGEVSALQYTEGLKVLGDQLKTLGEGMSEFEKQAQRNIQDAFGKTLVATLKGDFDSILDLWANLLVQMAAQAAAAQLNTYLFGGDAGFSSGALSKGLGWLASTFGGFFAEGGTLGAGKWGIAGENGLEVVKGPAEMVPLKAIGLGRQPAAPTPAPISIVQHVTVQSGVGRNELLQGMAVAKQQAVSEIYETQRRGRAGAMA